MTIQSPPRPIKPSAEAVAVARLMLADGARENCPGCIACDKARQVLAEAEREIERLTVEAAG